MDEIRLVEQPATTSTFPRTAISDGRPVYMRIRDVIADAILDGVYAEGEMLPSVRALAAQQGANPLTAAKAYHYFQQMGLIDVRRGVGMTVAKGAQARLRESEKRRFLAEEWPEICNRIKRLAINRENLLDIF